MKRITPVVLIGLGETGSQSVATIRERLVSAHRELEPIVSCLALGSDSLLVDCADNASLSVHGLKDSADPLECRNNYRAAMQATSQIVPWMGDRLSRLLRQDLRMPLEEAGYSIDTGLKIVLVTELADPVGSAVLLPFLGVLQELLSGRMAATLFDTEILGFFPDVFPKSRDSEDAYGRAYTCLQELEYVAENPTLLSMDGNAPYNSIFVFSARNEEGVEVASSEELLIMSGEFLGGMLRRDFASDSSYSLALSNVVEGKTTRYSSFGLAQLVFPVDDVMGAIASHYQLSYLKNAVAVEPPEFNTDLVSADVKDFVGGTALDRLPALMRTNQSGGSLYVEFQYSGSLSDKVDAGTFHREIEEQSEEFAKTTGTAMSRGLAIRRDTLLRDHQAKLVEQTDRLLDAPESGLYYASAFLDILRDSPSRYVKDDGTIEHYSLTVVETNAKRYFDSLFGIDRLGLSRARRNLADKKALLSEREKRIATSEVADSEVEDSGSRSSEALVETLDELKAEIARLERDVAERETGVEEFDLRLADAAHRRGMLQDLSAKQAEEKSTAVKKLESTEIELHLAVSTLEDLYQQRRATVFKLMFMLPVLLAVLVASFSLIRGRLKGLGTLAALEWGLALLPSLLGPYAIGAAIWYFIRTHQGIRAGELAVERARSEKRKAMLQLQGAYTSQFKTSFEHELFSGLIGWIAEYRTTAAQLSGKAEGFIRALASRRDEIEAYLAKLSFPNTPLVRSAVTTIDIPAIIASVPEAPHEAESFNRKNGLASFFAAFKSDSHLGRLDNALFAFTEEVYGKIRSQSIEEILQRTLAPVERLSARLNQLYQASQAFIQLGIDRGSDVSQTMAYIGTKTDDPSIVREVFSRLGNAGVGFFATGNQYELTAARLKVGFPAFHIALIPYGRRVVHAGERDRFAVDPEWDLPDLIPSAFISGGADDAGRQMFCIGRAFKIITQEGRSFVFEQTDIGTTFEECVAVLRRTTSGKLRGQLGYRIEAAKRSPDAAERLMEFKLSVKGDPVDLEILERLIAELSPLA